MLLSTLLLTFPPQPKVKPRTKPQLTPHPHPTTKMSAPKQGRQSPEPESQDPKQGSAPVAAPNEQNAAPSMDYAKDESEKQKSAGGLPSNPTGGMMDQAKEKTEKTV